MHISIADITYPIKLSGDEFNKKYSGVVLYKLTNEHECHNGFLFKDGLNVDNIDMTDKECAPGGIYFTDEKKYFKWLLYYDDGIMKYVRKVEIPKDATVYVYEDKYKADKIILQPKVEIKDIIRNKLCLEDILEFNVILNYLDKKSDVCVLRDILLGDGLAIRYIQPHMLTDELCTIAVKQNGNAIDFIPDKLKSHSLRIIAMRQRGYASR